MKNWLRNFLGISPQTHAPNAQPHPALQHLQITFQPAEYLEILQNWKRYEPPDGYQEKLPSYVVARCPFCNAAYRVKLDTHSLEKWYGITADSAGKYIQREKDEQSGCGHFLGVHPFINLNGIFPQEKSRYFENHYDVPFISPLFLPDEVPSYAVMHSLPICRIEAGRFVPRYYLYTITYYVPENYVWWETISSASGKLRHGIIAERRGAEPRGEWQSFLYSSSQAGKHPEWWDLPLWVKKKKLLWLDPASPDLALKSGPVEDFPYANIQGYRRSIEIRDGKLKFKD